jgi:hypothetical protein
MEFAGRGAGVAATLRTQNHDASAESQDQWLSHPHSLYFCCVYGLQLFAPHC